MGQANQVVNLWYPRKASKIYASSSCFLFDFNPYITIFPLKITILQILFIGNEIRLLSSIKLLFIFIKIGRYIGL